MGFDIRWLVPGRIIDVTITGEISIEDLENESNIILDMFAESDAPLVHVITNEAALESLPTSLQMFSDALDFMRDPRLGWMIMYPSNDSMSKFLSGMVAGISKVRYRRFDTLEESLQFLVTVDTSLPTVEDMLEQ